MKFYELGEIIDRIELDYPGSYALEWDNPGLLCGSRKKQVKKLLIALDATDEAVDLASKEGCDLILTHHPMIFSAIKSVNDESFIGRRLIKLIKNDISLYAMHTNFDVAPEGMGMIVAKQLGLKELCPMEVTGEKEGRPIGVGFFARLDSPLSAEELSRRIKESFGIGQVIYYDAHRPIESIAVCPGSGRGMLPFARELSADAFITGDMGHHDGIDAVAQGISLIDAGHFGLEHVFVPYMEGLIKDWFEGIEVLTFEADDRRFV